ncbi:hypothetical protein EXT46_14670 [Pseudoalteromonas sp. CO325X]|uniref:hypothetical protein n=1 Tax=Pseudoalteromonas sp. CO325X TaxID=1777262 RepID=UPI0010233DEE|nr:hypothetical protein [Pseudoalteromonas sp. CO325X]RZF79137.1 hypothetical protein EXT46_14670 [Pseudoalteromonas sp. CO325X]
MPEKDSRHFFNLTNIAAVVSLSVPLLYIIGHLYFQGYLSVYNQSVDSLSLPFESILMKSFYVTSGAVINLLEAAFGSFKSLLIWGGFLFLYSAVLMYLEKHSDSVKKKIAEKKQHFRGSRLFRYAFLPTVVALLAVGIPVFVAAVLFVLFAFIWSSHSYGAKFAKEEIADFAYCNAEQKAVCTTVHEPSGQSTQGVLIASTDKFVALYTGQKVVLISNQNLKIETQPKK